MASDRFFETPEQQSLIKTQLVSKYFGAWSKIMLSQTRSSAAPIAYMDLFSGPGRYEDGTASTPILLLQHVVQDSALCDRLITFFNDVDRAHADQLRSVISALPGITKLRYQPRVTGREVGTGLVEVMDSVSNTPTLYFLDPWGYKGLSLDLLAHSIKNWGSESIFFFNYNRINLALSNEGVARRMDELFGWERAQALRARLRGKPSAERQKLVLSAIVDALKHAGGKFVLPFQFESRQQDRTSHYVIFVTKHFRGYSIMKDIMFGLSSDEGDVRSLKFMPTRARQLRLLFEFEKPHSIESLKQHLLSACAGKSLQVERLYEHYSVDTPYTNKNFKDAIRRLEAEGKIRVNPPAEERRVIRGEVSLRDDAVVTFPP